MSQDGNSKDDVKVPEGELGKQIEDDFDAGKDLLVTIISAMGEEQVRFPLAPDSTRLLTLHCLLTQAISYKEAPKGA